MRLRRWGAAAVGVLLLAGCGTSIGGQAAPVPPPVASPTPTSLSVAPFPSPSSAATTPTIATPPSGSDAATTTTPNAIIPTATPSTTAAPSTTVTWLLPLPKPGTPKLNKFGNIVAAPGQPFALSSRSTKKTSVVFIVDSLQVDRGCEGSVRPENGHMLVISVRVQLGYATAEELDDESVGFTADLWTAFDAKDTAELNTGSTAAETCLTSKTALPFVTDMGPDRVYSGKVALDVSSATGTAVLMNLLDGGWIYHYG